MANSRQNIRKLVKDGFVIRKPQKVSTAAPFLSDTEIRALSDSHCSLVLW